MTHIRAGGDLNSLVKSFCDARWHGVHLDSTWYQLLKECLDRFRDALESQSQRVDSVLRVLGEMTLSSDPGTVWAAARSAVLEDIDLLSGWKDYGGQAIRHGYSVYRQRGVNYAIIDGEAHETVGMQTDTEERWNLISNACTSPYSGVNSILRIVALLAICLEYKVQPEQFPRSLAVMLPETETGTSYLHWDWYMKWPYQPRRVPWRPKNNICDPIWLSADLLASFAEKEEIPETEIDPPSPDGLMVRYEQEFAGFKGQLEFSLDTPLRFGSGPEEWFKFQGLTLRWVNSTQSIYTTIVVPVRNRNDDAAERQLAMTFLSCFAFQTDMPITIMSGLSIHRRFAPMCRDSVKTAGVLYSNGFTFHEIANLGDKERLAYAFYREGLGSSSVYYAFLNFYKIIQLAFNEKPAKIKNWVNGNIDKVPDDYGIVGEIRGRNEDVVDYLFKSCRCAIAHTKQEPITDPDSPEDRARVGKALPLVKGLARHAINSGVFGKTDGDVRYQSIVS